MNLDNYNFAGGDRTRTEMLSTAVQGQPADIAAALSEPGVPDELLAQPFEVVTALADLRGPATGTIPVPEAVADPALTGSFEATDSRACALLYQRVLLRGSTSLQSRVLARTLLVQLWPQLASDLPEAVTRVWQGRFPELAQARQATPWNPRTH